MEVDHINHNPRDNRKINLRICTHRENMQNRRIQKNNKTGYSRIALCANGKYLVKYRNNGKVIYVGTYKTLEDAIIAKCNIRIDNASKD